MTAPVTKKIGKVKNDMLPERQNAVLVEALQELESRECRLEERAVS